MSVFGPYFPAFRFAGYHQPAEIFYDYFGQPGTGAFRRLL